MVLTPGRHMGARVTSQDPQKANGVGSSKNNASESVSATSAGRKEQKGISSILEVYLYIANDL